jgi:predicted TIM-barrel fold metal-dependent hydrolase
MGNRFLLAVVLAAQACSRVSISQTSSGPRDPLADHHQHLFSPVIAGVFKSEGRDFPAFTAPDLVALLDVAGIRRAVVLSVAYMYGSPSRTVTDELAKVRAENDWTAAQVSQYPDRLVGFCSVNPLKEYAVDEIARCATIKGVNTGLKLHFGNSDVQLENPEHLEKVQRVFRAANEWHMAIAIHMRANITKKRPYGEEQARIFLEQLLPLAKDIPVHVAHLAGTGPGYDDPPADVAMAFLAEAVARGDKRTHNLWFDVSGIATAGMPAEQAARMALRIRQVGVKRVLYGSDAAVPGNSPQEAWSNFKRLPLTPAEFAQIATNVAPYLSGRP